jgi:hypothetical protein
MNQITIISDKAQDASHAVAEIMAQKMKSLQLLSNFTSIL